MLFDGVGECWCRAAFVVVGTEGNQKTNELKQEEEEDKRGSEGTVYWPSPVGSMEAKAYARAAYIIRATTTHLSLFIFSVFLYLLIQRRDNCNSRNFNKNTSTRAGPPEDRSLRQPHKAPSSSSSSSSRDTLRNGPPRTNSHSYRTK